MAKKNKSIEIKIYMKRTTSEVVENGSNITSAMQGFFCPASFE